MAPHLDCQLIIVRLNRGSITKFVKKVWEINYLSLLTVGSTAGAGKKQQ